MTIKVGDTIPAVTIAEMVKGSVVKHNTHELFAQGKFVIFGLPGAFTPVCSKEQLPGYISRAAEFKDKGISDVFCLSINDAFVMDAWGREQKADGKIRLLADGNGELIKALGLEEDMSASLMGTRSQRFVMFVENNTIIYLQIDPLQVCKVSGADDVLDAL